MSLRSYVSKNAKLLTESDIKWQYAPVEIEDELPENVELDKALKSVSSLMPESLLRDIGGIKVAADEKLSNRGVDALLEGGSQILVTNQQESTGHLVKDIVHEISHIAERQYADKIYSDDGIKKEFLSKRKALAGRIEQEGYDVPRELTTKIKYDKGVDHFLWKKVGYSELAQLGHDLFFSPYAATSLREYWGTAFEEYFVGSPAKVNRYASSVYDKIQELL